MERINEHYLDEMFCVLYNVGLSGFSVKMDFPDNPTFHICVLFLFEVTR